MTSAIAALPHSLRKTPAPLILAGLAFVVAFGLPARLLIRDWLFDADSGHGLLLFPVACWLVWKRGLVPAAPQPRLGLAILVFAVALRYLSGLAAELLTMRASLGLAVLALIIYWRGTGQVLRWWLPVALVALSIPLPDVVVGSLALPLQLKASEWGAALLEMRHVPVRLAGNVINLPGRSLFVTEACSGLRSLTALLALGLLVGGLWLRTWWGRTVLVLAAIPVAMALNAVRIFLTGFLVYFVDPRLAEGVMHYSEGWVTFVVAFGILGAMTWVILLIERARRASA